ncbi:MAG: hypothetical protein JOZ08_17120 [Verrucomicrobia bacterium]|nr:hypothetical protein [Verrucomicrobiota bacterium]
MLTFDIPTGPASYADKLAERKESARNTIREATVAELRTLVTELFPDGTHPFAEPVTRFIEEHKTERVYRGETSDGISFVYYPKANNGLWYTFVDKLPSVGRLGRNSLKVLAEIMVETGRS